MTLFDTAVATDHRRVAGATQAAAPARERVWSARVFAVTVACLALHVCGIFVLWRLRDAVVPWDSKNHFYPMFRFLADALQHGTVPFWNPYHFSGYPAVADPQSLIFTPSLFLFALAAPGASMQTFDAVILAHVFVGGLGVLVLARRWGWHPAAGFLAALVFAFGGAAAGRLEHTGMIVSYIYFPWALWSLQGALRRRSVAWACGAGLAVALMALGRDQVAFTLCIALLGCVAWEALASWAPLSYVLARAPLLFCAGLVTLALMIVPILLTLQFIHGSNRPSITYGVALAGSLSPSNLLTLIAPNVFGSLDRIYDYWGPGTGLILGNDWTDKTDRTIDYMFIGTAPFVLLVWHGLAGGRLLRRGPRFFVALFAFALVYALGRYTPLFGVIFDYVPGVSLYRRPADASFSINVALAFGAGYLMNRYIGEGLPRPRAALLPYWLAFALPAAVAGCGAVLIGGGLALAQRYGHFDVSVGQLALAAATAAGVVLVLALAGARRRTRTIAALCLAVATSGELAWRNAASAINAEARSIYSAYNGFNPDEARGMAALRTDLARRAALGEHPRVEIIGINGSWQNASMVLKLEDTIGYNPLRMSDYESAVGPVESALDIDLRRFPGLFRGYTCKLARLLGLDYLVLDRPLDRLPRQFPRPKAELLSAGQDFYVYRLDNVIVPRASFAGSVKLVDSRAVIAEERMPDFDAPKEALVDGKDAGALPPGLVGAVIEPGQEAGTAAIASYEANAVTIDVDAARAGVLVLHDLAYPGWTVTLDGEPAQLLRADVLFRGAVVPAGHHRAVFRFRPLSFANLAAAASGLLRSKP